MRLEHWPHLLSQYRLNFCFELLSCHSLYPDRKSLIFYPSPHTRLSDKGARYNNILNLFYTGDGFRQRFFLFQVTLA